VFTFVVSIGLGATMIVLGMGMTNADRLSDINPSSLTQVSIDWTTKPFVSLRVSDTPCDVTEEESLFVREWLGTQEGCFVGGRQIMTKAGYNSWASNGNNDNPPPCVPIPANAPVMQTEFHGKYFCGVKGGESFENVIRPSVEGACPAGTSACSDKTSPENTVCYANLEDCPITSIEFTDSPPSSDSGYTILNTGVEAISLVYSKTQEDSLPISKTRVENKPCADPSVVSREGPQGFYKLELSQSGVCAED